MKTIPLLAVLTALAAVGPCASGHGATQEGVALAIIFDTSGSMKEAVRDANGKQAMKYVIARRALVAVARQIGAFATNAPGGAPRAIHTGLYVFGNNEQGKEALKFGPFNATVMEEWAYNFHTPAGNTPLGNTLRTASQAVLKSSLSRKHVLVITDGMNTAGPKPEAVMPQLKQQAQQQQTSLSVHFVAFDVAAKVFDPVRKLGATVVSAADEAQLNSQLQFILQKKILLEDEEPAKTK